MKIAGLLVGFCACVAFAEPSAAPETGAAGCSDGVVVSSIEFKGLERTNPRVVKRELLNKVGEPFSAEKFETEKLRLQDLDLFTEITVTCTPVAPQPSSNQDTLSSLVSRLSSNQDTLSSLVSRLSSNLTYTFKEIFRWIPSPAGKTTDRDGLMLGLALANLNLLGEDIRVEVQYRTSTDPFFDKNEYVLYASSPYLFGFPLGWNFEFSHTDSYDDIRDYHDNSWLLDLDLDYKFLPHMYILATVGGRKLDRAALLPEFGLGFAFDYRDAKIDTRKGIYFEYMLTHVGGLDEDKVACEGGCESMGTENFWELLADARAYYTVSRFVTGATSLVRYRPGEVKFYDYFSHGGVNSYRGRYGDAERLGVHEALLNLEERFVLLDRQSASICGVNFFYGVQLVAGLDGSLIWNSGHPGWDNYEGAVYGGVHLVIPAVDRLRFEVGYSPDRGEPKYFFGIMEKVSTSRWRSR
ncbi:POTRA domain-containing protein [Fibrobacter sp.]|uniref:POTRA domain-containing protein n=1 Tax=Fibrobacter sp. TaxID=35828 RepID=UPI0025C06C96|nr:POTRA domain-containing protein [Fibrobacter sp.]